MKLLVTNVHFPPDAYGGATVVADLTSQELTARGHEVHVLTTTADSRVPVGTIFSYQHGGCFVHALRLPASRTVEEDYYGEENSSLYRQAFELLRPDAHIAHSIQGLGVSVIDESLRAGIPTAVYVHDSWWQCTRHFMLRPEGVHCGQWQVDPTVCATCVERIEDQQTRVRESLARLNAVSWVLTPSSFWAQFLTANGVDGQRVVVVPNGIRRSARPWPRRPRTPLRFGFVGGVGPGKGSPEIVKAFAELGRQDYELWVVDSHVNLGRRTIIEDDFPVPGRLEILPGYSGEGLGDYFSSIDVLLAPSNVRESYGLAVREAIVHGVWPVLKDVGGPRDHVVDGRNGTVLPWGSGADALRNALASILDDPASHLIGEKDADAIPTVADQVDGIEDVLRRL